MDFAAIIVSPDQWGPPMPIVDGGSCRPIIWPGMGAVERSLHEFQLPSGASTIDLEHPGEAVYYVVDGQIDVWDAESDSLTRVGPGGMFHVEPVTRYRFSAAGAEAVVLGGPSPADPALYVGLDAMKQSQSEGRR